MKKSKSFWMLQRSHILLLAQGSLIRPQHGFQIVRFITQSSSSASAIQDCRSYLKYCESNKVDTTSTVFRGTLYELSCMEFLKKEMHCTNLIKVGGSYDNGLDLLGKWDLNHFYRQARDNYPDKRTLKKLPSTTLLSKSTEFTPGGISLQDDVNVLVQCKNFTKRIGPSTVRELGGIYNFHVKYRSASFHNILFFITLSELTKESRKMLDALSFPVMCIRLQPLHYSLKESYDPAKYFDLDNWHGGTLDGIYLNHNARNVLRGLNIELQLAITLKGSA